MAKALDRFDRMADHAAEKVIASYSTSFSLATNVLGPTVRRDIHNLYAMVRIADEIVDGTACAAGASPEACRRLLDNYEETVLAALNQRFHTDPIVHAFANTARRCQFDSDHIRAFFSSMRSDLEQSEHDEASFAAYVYGSAEVIGLLCVAVFVADHPVSDRRRHQLDDGARRLGAAFQKINFLRDLAEDHTVLQRHYFPGVDPTALTEGDKNRLIADIRCDLRAASEVLPLLPASARHGVVAASYLFSELTDRLQATAAEDLTRRRIRIPRHIKAMLVTKAVLASLAMTAR